MLQQIVTIYLSSLINLYQLDLTYSGDWTASIVSLVMMACCIATPLCMIALTVMMRFEVISKKIFEEKYGTITEGLKDTSIWAQLWSAIGVLKWLITLTILVTCLNYPCIQITLIYFLSIATQAFILRVQPNTDPSLNYIALANEVLVTITLLLFLLASDITPSPDIKIKAGFGLLGVLGISCMLNLGNFLIRVIHSIVQNIRRKWNIY